jgi:hypothetical protein
MKEHNLLVKPNLRLKAKEITSSTGVSPGLLALMSIGVQT